jgi:hypothetical protein
MPRAKLPTEYEIPLDLEGLGDRARAGEMPIASALGMLHRSAKLTQEMIESVAKFAQAGYQWDAIASRIGISSRALATWLRRGQERREQIDEWYDKRRTLADDAPGELVVSEIGLPPQEDDLLLLYDACARAHAEAECNLVDVIRDDALYNGNTSSAKWLLQARFKNWSGNGKLPRHADADDASGSVDAIDLLASKVAAVEERARAIAAASSVRSE